MLPLLLLLVVVVVVDAFQTVTDAVVAFGLGGIGVVFVIIIMNDAVSGMVSLLDVSHCCWLFVGGCWWLVGCAR